LLDVINKVKEAAKEVLWLPLSSGDLTNTVGVDDNNSKWKTSHLNEKGEQEGFIVIPW
jgi:hypothetical protein